MAHLEFKASINEVIANTESVVTVFVNGEQVTALSGENRTFSGKLQLPGGRNRVIVRRSYARDPDCDVWWRRLLVALFGLILYDGEPFSCLYEMEEQIELDLCGENPILEVSALQREDDLWPLFLITGDGCKWTSSRRITMSEEELKDTYTEWKRRLLMPLWLPFVLGVLGILLKWNSTTVTFLLILAVILGVISLISLLMLRKQYQQLRSQL